MRDIADVNAPSNSTPNSFKPPFRSTGTRRPPTRSAGSTRSFAVAPEFNREITAESNIERPVRNILLSRTDLVGLRDQWPKVKFIDTEGHERTHTFDYSALYSSGYAEAYAVKPSDRVDSKPKDGSPSLADTIDLIHAQGSLDGYAHRAVIVTDQDFSPGNVHNARYLRRARRFRDEKYVQEVRALLSTVGSRVLFHTLLQNSDVPGYRRLAVWNLIDDGVLIPELSGHVIDRSWLRVISNDMEVA